MTDLSRVLLAVGLGGLSACVPTSDEGSPQGEQVPAETTSALVIEGVCPFECCMYGTWVLDGPVDVHAEPDGSSPVTATVGAGARLQVPTGRVVVSEPGIAEIRDAITARDEAGDSLALAAGSQVEVLHPIGEGYARVRAADRLFSLDLMDERVQVTRQGEWTWWAQVTTPDGSGGWILADGAAVHGSDACGLPYVWSDSALAVALSRAARDLGTDPPELAERRTAAVELNGDLYDDALVLLLGPWCGSGGCTLLVLQGGPEGLALISRSTLVRPPILVSDRTTNGWRDLVIEVAGGGIEAKTVALRFDGASYSPNPSVLEPVQGEPRGTRVFEVGR